MKGETATLAHEPAAYRTTAGRTAGIRTLSFFGLGFEKLAEWTGLEPATPGVTGRSSNQLNYHSVMLGGC